MAFHCNTTAGMRGRSQQVSCLQPFSKRRPVLYMHAHARVLPKVTSIYPVSGRHINSAWQLRQHQYQYYLALNS